MTSHIEDVVESDDERHTPPPGYTEKDPYMGSKEPTDKLKEASFVGPSKSNVGFVSNPNVTNHLLNNVAPAGTPLVRKRQAPNEKEGNVAFVKGLMPSDLIGSPVAGESAYSIDTDPLLQDNTDSDHKVFIGFIQGTVIGLAIRNKGLLWKIITGIFLAGYTIYLGFAVAYSPYGAIAPLVVTGFGLLIGTLNLIKKYCGSQINHNFLIPFGEWWDRHWHIFRWFVYPAPLLGLVVYLSIMMTHIRQLQSLSGFVVFFCLVWLTSKYPNKVVWRPVLWGYTLQFIMALLVLQWDKGYTAIEWLSDYVSKIINFGFQGGAVIWGDPNMLYHPFVMMGMSLLIYVGAVMSILYYLGVTQIVASKLAWAMSALMGTTAIETLGVSANIMLNGMDVIIMLRAYLMKLTMSEFNCFMVGNNATIAGFMFGLLILYGAPPQHLLTAAVMSAPASIAIAKLNYPETVPEKSVTKNIDEVRLSRGPERNLFEAAANGSALAGRTAMTVAVNYISFMSLLNFIDAGLSWVGGRVGYTEFSFEWICSYLFFPIALLIGVDVNQCRQVAKVIGLKVFTTEIYAYQVLGELYESGVIDDRSKALGTYALCGFCSLSTLAIAIGIWQVLCPPRRPLVSKLMIRVMVQANISCFTTACVAGLFYSDKLAIFDSAERSPLQKFITWFLGRGVQFFT